MNPLRQIIAAAILGLAIPVSAEIIGVEPFDYPPSSPIAGMSGGNFWDYKNTTPVGHTNTTSNWDNVSGAPTVTARHLVTDNSSAKREYNGANEGEGAISPTSVAKRVYYAVKVSTGATLPTFFGLSSYEGGAERLFFGKLFSIANFGVQESGVGYTAATLTAAPNTTYTLVARLDFESDEIRLYVNPDLNAAEPATATAARVYTGISPSTAVRLASGAGGPVTWDNLVVATAWEDFRTAVTTTADAGAGSLRQAVINAANNPGPDTITFDPALSGQTITLTGQGSSTAIDITDADGMTIDATSLPGGLTIQRDSNNSNKFRLFSIASGTSLTLRGLTLAHGGGYGFGPGGGAIFNLGTLALTQCSLSSNQSGGGGAIDNWGTLTLTQCTLSGNSANSNGGAISNANSLTLTQCTLSSNSASTNGGAIYNNGGTLTLTQCSLSGNFAGTYGGAIYTTGTLTLTHCTLSGNAAPGNGGAIYTTGTLTLTHCTLSGNSAPGNGGAIYATGTLTLQNSIVAGNNAFNGEDIYQADVSVTRIGANIVQLVSNSGTVTESGPAAITAAPLLAPLASNGGPTQTMALLPGSPAIDAATVIAGLDTDQRGLPRSRDGDGTAGAAPDIGAYEAQVAPVGSLGFNFNGASPRDLAATDTAGAPGFAQTHWNNLSGDYGYANGNHTTLGGALVQVRRWHDAAGVWQFGPAPSTPGEKLMRGYLDSNGAANSGTDLYQARNQPFFALADLPAALTLGGYRVVVYADTDAADGRVGEYWLTTMSADPGDVAGTTDLSPRLFLKDSANFSGTYTRVPATSTERATAAEGNYLVFENQTQPAFILRTEDNPSFRAGLNAVQIVRNELLVVTTTADENDPVGTAGAGLSLREAVALAPDGAGIVFDSALGGQTITLNAALGEILLSRDVTIDAGNLPAGVTIAGDSGTKRIFVVGSEASVILNRLTLTGGNGAGSFLTGRGGAIYNMGTLALAQCTLHGNSAPSFGGAIYNVGTLTLTRCTLSGNSTTLHGGAIYNGNLPLTLTQCTLSGNSANLYGGAIYNLGPLTLTQCTLSGNSANYVGAIYNLGALTLTQSTLSGNSANYVGGGILNGSNLTLTNSIVAGNTVSPGGSGPDIYSITVPLTPNGVNLIGDLADSWLTAGPAVLVGAPLLAPLGDYGGPTRTMPPLPGSPAIDAAVGGTAATDQRGFASPRDGDGNGAAIADIGAVELHSLVVTTATDENDTPAGALLSLREAVRDHASGPVPSDIIAFATGLGPVVLGSEIVIAHSVPVTIDGGGIAGGATIDGGPGINRILTVNSNATVTLRNLTLTGGNGSGASGGAILNNGSLALTDCRLTANAATSAGAIHNNRILTLARCSLYGNEATSFGGGAMLNRGSLTLTRSAITGNTAATNGGAVESTQPGSTLVLAHCTLSGNSAGNSGGAVNFDPRPGSGAATLTHCTLSGNTAVSAGGAILQAGGTLTLANSIVAGNTAGISPDIRRNSGTLTNGGGNLIGRNNSVTTEFPAGPLVGTSANPLNPLLAPLGDYGGPTRTMALLPGSAARNAASALAPPVATDQRDFPIIGTPDIGAYEAGTFSNYPAYIWESLPTAGNGTITDPLHAGSHDFDGDGHTNGEEWIARTDPAASASHLHATLSAPGGALQVTFPTVPGRTYQLQSAPNPAGPWADLGGPVSGTGGNMSLPVDAAGQARRCIRVGVR